MLCEQCWSAAQSHLDHLALQSAVLIFSRPPQHMALDSMTGLDPEGVALRATEGLLGVDYFFPVRLPPELHSPSVSWKVQLTLSCLGLGWQCAVMRASVSIST